MMCQYEVNKMDRHISFSNIQYQYAVWMYRYLLQRPHSPKMSLTICKQLRSRALIMHPLRYLIWPSQLHSILHNFLFCVLFVGTKAMASFQVHNAGSKGDGKSRLFSPSQGTAHAILICSHPFLSPPSPTISHRLSLALLFFWWWMAMAIDADGRRCTLRGDSIAANGRPCTSASRVPYGRGKKHNSTAPLPIRRCPRVATRASPSMGTTTLHLCLVLVVLPSS